MHTLNLRHLYLSLILSLAITSSSFAQNSFPPEAQTALVKGGQAAALALATYEEHFIDKPLWREAVTYGLEAQRLAPNDPRPYRFLGQVYSNITFYARAWSAWTSYINLGGEMTAQTAPYLKVTSSWLGNKSFRENDFQSAILYYSKLHELEPASEEANQHLALSHIELGSPKEAEPYLENLAGNFPNKADYINLLSRTEEQITYGVEASNAYHEGISAYASGNKQAALDAFRRSTAANENFSNSFVWAGRISSELGQLGPAQGYWQQAVRLEPTNQEAREALATVEGQQKWGKEAHAVFEQGLDFYQQGKFGEALWSFQRATQLNSNYGDAWAWLGQLSVEARDFQNAVTYYGSAIRLEPSNPLYTTAYSQSERLLTEQLARQAPSPVGTPIAATTTPSTAPTTAATPTAAATTPQTTTPPAVTETPTASVETPTASVETPTPQPTPSTDIPTPTATVATAPAVTALPTPTATVQLPAPLPTPNIATAPTPVTATPASVAQPQLPAPNQTEPTIVASVARPETPVLTPTPAPSVAVVAPQPVPVPPVPEAAIANGGPAVTLLSVDYTHESPENGGSGAFSFFNSPSSLVSDLSAPVDYATGTLHQRIEVNAKPSGEAVQYEVCLVHNDDLSIGPACAQANSLRFEESGVYETAIKLSSFSNYNQIDWSKGLQQVMLIIKDKDGNTVDDRFLFKNNNNQNVSLTDFYPMQVTYRAIIVPAGGSFPGW